MNLAQLVEFTKLQSELVTHAQYPVESEIKIGDIIKHHEYKHVVVEIAIENGVVRVWTKKLLTGLRLSETVGYFNLVSGTVRNKVGTVLDIAAQQEKLEELKEQKATIEAQIRELELV